MTQSQNSVRYSQLRELEMQFNGECFQGIKDYNQDFNVYPVEITCDSESEWDSKMIKLQTELTRRKSKSPSR